MPRDPKLDELIAQQEAAVSSIPDRVSKQVFSPYVSAASFSYDPRSTTDQNKNFERYYSHPSFSKLGFNPWVDNESLYNNNSSGLGDMWRAIKTAGKLAATGFKAPIRSYGAALTGDFTGLDYDSADEMNYYNAVGSSTRGGVSGFASNLMSNSGYTVGMIGELVLENYLTSGIGSAFKGTQGALQVGKFTKDLGKYEAALGTLKEINNYSAAEKLWNAAKSITPLANTFEAAKDIYQASKSGSVNAAVASYKTAGALYQDIQAANFTVSEARMEGAAAQRDAEERMLAKFREEHGGRYPDDQEYATLKENAKDAGTSNMIANIPVIFLTNKLTFDPLLKSFAQPTEYTLRNGARFMRQGDKLVEATFMNRTRAAFKPKNWGIGAVKYFRGNLSEGLQESLQDITAGTAVDYYANLYGSKTRSGLDHGRGEYTNDSMWDALAKNTVDQLSGKGFETFASGFFMGGLVSPVSAGIEKIAGYRKTKNDYTQKTLATLNEYYKDPLRFFSSRDINYTTSAEAVKGQYEALDENDKKKWLDNEFENLASNTKLALDTGSYDLFLDKLRDIRSMTPEAIKETFGRDGQEILSKVDSLISRAETVKQKYEEWNLRLQNPFSPTMYHKDTPEYTREAIGYSAWEQAKSRAIFDSAKVEDNATRIKNIASGLLAQAGTNKIPSNYFNALTSPIQLQKEIGLLKDEIEVLEYNNNREELKAKKNTLKHLEDFNTTLTGLYLHQDLEGLSPEAKKALSLDKQKRTDQNKLFKSYSNYLKSLNPSSSVSNVELRKSFDELLDLHELGIENVITTETVNTLADPQGFLNYYERLNSAFTDLYNSKGDIIKKGIELAQKSTEDNSILQTLYDRGFVLSPQSVDKLINDKAVPERFFDINAKQAIDARDPRYQKFKDIVDNYLNVTKPEEEVVTEEQVEQPEVAQEQGKTKEDVQAEDVLERIPGVKNLDELDALKAEFETMFRLFDRRTRKRMNLTANKILKGLEARRQEFHNVISMSNLPVGTVVQLTNKEHDKGMVSQNTGKKLTIDLLNKNLKITVEEKDLKDTVLGIQSEAAQDTQPTDKEKELATQSSEQVTNFINSSRQVLEKTMEEALADPEKFEKEFEETLGCV